MSLAKSSRGMYLKRADTASDISELSLFQLLGPWEELESKAVYVYWFYLLSYFFFQPLVLIGSVWKQHGERNPCIIFSHAATPSGFLPDPQVLIGELGDVIPPACHAPWSVRKNTSRRRDPGASLTDA